MENRNTVEKYSWEIHLRNTVEHNMQNLQMICKKCTQETIQSLGKTLPHASCPWMTIHNIFTRIMISNVLTSKLIRDHFDSHLSLFLGCFLHYFVGCFLHFWWDVFWMVFCVTFWVVFCVIFWVVFCVVSKLSCLTNVCDKQTGQLFINSHSDRTLMMMMMVML